ncbi:MAG: hypothetical protein AB7O37_16860 [Vicinamibacteria bacterium]
MKEDASALRPRALGHSAGVYAFWWTANPDRFAASDCIRELILKGPGGRDVHLAMDDQWLGLGSGLPMPLYVGKTTNLAKRGRQHLELGRPRLLGAASPRKGRNPTTACQLRAGIERMFPGSDDSRALVLDSVGLSFVELDGDVHAVNRFYLEDLAVGLMRPFLNIDVER